MSQITQNRLGRMSRSPAASSWSRLASAWHRNGRDQGQGHGRKRDRAPRRRDHGLRARRSRASRTVSSTTDGDFHFPLLPVGTYTLTFKLQGFDTVKEENVIVRLGHDHDHDADYAARRRSRRKSSSRPRLPLIDKTSTDTSYYLSAADLVKVPAQNRTILDAVKLAPGVTGVPDEHPPAGPATEGQPSFRGEGEEGNAWIVDGLAISGVRLKDAGVKLNYDSLEEIQVISDPFSPEFGSAYGGIINMVTKSGSNDVPGRSEPRLPEQEPPGRPAVPALRSSAKPDISPTPTATSTSAARSSRTSSGFS